MTTKDISFIRFRKSKNPAVQECYSLKTKGFRARLFFGFGLFKRNLKQQLSRKYDLENIVGNKQTTKQFCTFILKTGLLKKMCNSTHTIVNFQNNIFIVEKDISNIFVNITKCLSQYFVFAFFCVYSLSDTCVKLSKLSWNLSTTFS